MPVQPAKRATSLHRQAHVRLNHERIGQERQQAAGIARGLQKIRIAGPRMTGERKPRLHQGAVAETITSGSVAVRHNIPSRTSAGLPSAELHQPVLGWITTGCTE
ncbi:MAG TPA: hypothetical protein VKA15_16475 [Isosphaeraceae bacterium]|nr:hypothetical protein [Isosphaeraceae bacterium]